MENNKGLDLKMLGTATEAILCIIILGLCVYINVLHTSNVYYNLSDDYNECVEDLPRNKDCVPDKMQFKIVNK